MHLIYDLTENNSIEMWKYYNMDMQSYTYDVKLSHSLYPHTAQCSWAVLCSVWICSCVLYRLVSVHLTIRILMCRCHHFRYSYCVSFVLFLPFSSSASNSHTHTQLSTENGQMIQSYPSLVCICFPIFLCCALFWNDTLFNLIPFSIQSCFAFSLMQLILN